MSPISVVIPAFNEEASIRKVIAHIDQTLTLAGVEHEIVVVDDGSTDRTAEEAALAQVVVCHPKNMGYGRSLKSGIAAARHELIGILDADSSYPVERLPEMIQMSELYHMVVGARTGRIYHGGWVKRIGRVVFRRLAEFAAGQRIPDINSGMRVFRRRQIMPFFPIISSGFSFTTTVTLVYLLNDLFVGYLPIEYHRRAGSSKVHHLRDSLRALQIIVEAILRCNPIKIFLLMALPFAVTGLVLGGTALAIHSWMAAIAGLLAVGMACLLLGMGFLAVAVMPPKKIIDEN